MEKSRFKVNFGGSIHERILNWFSGNSKVWLFKWDEKTAHCYAKKKVKTSIDSQNVKFW